MKKKFIIGMLALSLAPGIGATQEVGETEQEENCSEEEAGKSETFGSFGFGAAITRMRAKTDRGSVTKTDGTVMELGGESPTWELLRRLSVMGFLNVRSHNADALGRTTAFEAEGPVGGPTLDRKVTTPTLIFGGGWMRKLEGGYKMGGEYRIELSPSKKQNSNTNQGDIPFPRVQMTSAKRGGFSQQLTLRMDLPFHGTQTGWYLRTGAEINTMTVAIAHLPDQRITTVSPVYAIGLLHRFGDLQARLEIRRSSGKTKMKDLTENITLPVGQPDVNGNITAVAVRHTMTNAYDSQGTCVSLIIDKIF
ncbi:MAG: hypothetical protein LBS14_03370 [Holosporaceae bacterium]|jgi:hypothetical protein|nr:hypothetical protein [Holosporaceae bacterium]